MANGIEDAGDGLVLGQKGLKGRIKGARLELNFGKSDIAQTFRWAAIGGTASVLGGGKFANGAQTGAFQYLVNTLVTSGESGKKIQVLRQQSPHLNATLNRMQSSEDTYVISDGAAPNSGGGSTTTRSYLNGTRLIDMRANPGEITTFKDINGNDFRVGFDRILVHEVGHGASVLNQGIGSGRQAVEFENKVMQQVSPGAPIRHPTDEHGGKIWAQ